MLERLDFVYLPSRDVAGDVAHFTAGLGADLVFAIEAFGTRVAMVRLAPHPPPLLLAQHLEGEKPVLVYRVADLDREIVDLRDRGLGLGTRFEIPHGPGVELANRESRGSLCISSLALRPTSGSPVAATSIFEHVGEPLGPDACTARPALGPATHERQRDGHDDCASWTVDECSLIVSAGGHCRRQLVWLVALHHPEIHTLRLTGIHAKAGFIMNDQAFAEVGDGPARRARRGARSSL